ncbi:helix-turn-helix domain-containing protein [Nonomuraea sp. NN258]|uniref:helix-turn-helix domain-containing protein n=1 Tax=Nonomuraea antri TaxID=2730852 RepID=UPI001568CC82|nr:helix-turn-helix transcriptional regulator [Nonomuraea antri]NRQ40039.1 helix-turn-helix domain-containing protein [Nonomuraea antri]
MGASELDPRASPLALFGAELRRLRDKKGVTQEEIATYTHVSKSLVSQIENARRTPQWDFTEQVEQLLGLKGELLRLLPLVIKAGPTWFRQWPRIEAGAHNLRTWQPLVIPGLLQTRAYAHAVLSGQPGISKERVDEATEARMARQVVFERPEPPMYAAVIDEGVLQRPIGGAEVMREQLGRLLELLTHPCITVQIVPVAAVPTIGLLGGFVIAQLSQGPDTVYLDSAADGEVTDRQDKVRTVSLRFDAIRSYARPVNETEAAIREKMVMYEPV